MEPKNESQRTVADFVNVTVKEAFDGLAKTINAGGEFTAEVDASMPTKGLGRIKLVIREPNSKYAQMNPVFIFTVDASPFLDSARVWFEAGPMMVDGERKNSHSGDLRIPGVAVNVDATARQVRDYVRRIANEAIEGHRVRRYYQRPRQ